MTTNDSERMAFEDAFIKIRPGASFTRHAKYPSVYLWEHVEEAWSTWQARGEYERLRTPPAEARQDVVERIQELEIFIEQMYETLRAKKIRDFDTNWRMTEKILPQLECIHTKDAAEISGSYRKIHLSDILSAARELITLYWKASPTTDEAAHADMLAEALEMARRYVPSNSEIVLPTVEEALLAHDKRRANKEQGS